MIKTAQKKIKSQGIITKKSFVVVGITNSEEEFVRKFVEDVFGDTNEGYISADGNPFANGEELVLTMKKTPLTMKALKCKRLGAELTMHTHKRLVR